jgi:hypothetical protein
MNDENILHCGGGYIALISVIIISLLLITVTAALSCSNYFSRLNILENEFKIKSGNLAVACVNYAKTKLAGDPLNYAGNELSVPVGADICSILSVSPTGATWPKTIKTRGIYPGGQTNQSYTNLTVILNSDFTVNSWQETAD